MKRQTHTILLAEDDRNDQLFIQHAFRANGVTAQIRIVPNGREAIAYLAGEGPYADRHQYPFPSFVLTDLKMPVLDGFAVLETMKKHPDWAVIPIVVLSASADEDDIKKAYLLGASSYLAKPQGIEELTSLLKKFFDYWEICEVPRVDPSGRQLPTESAGKLGARFPQEPEHGFYRGR